MRFHITNARYYLALATKCRLKNAHADATYWLVAAATHRVLALKAR